MKPIVEIVSNINREAPGSVVTFDVLLGLFGGVNSNIERRYTAVIGKVERSLSETIQAQSEKSNTFGSELKKEHKMPKIFFDLRLQGTNIGGYYNPSDPGKVFINPMVLWMGTDADLFHVILHEALHANYIQDESITELLTIIALKENGYMDYQESGYQEELIEPMKAYLEKRAQSVAMIGSLIDPANNMQTLSNFLWELFMRPAWEDLIIKEIPIDNPRKMLSQALHKHWSLIQILFPRLLRQITDIQAREVAALNLPAKDIHLSENLFNEIFQLLSSKMSTAGVLES